MSHGESKLKDIFSNYIFIHKFFMFPIRTTEELPKSSSTSGGQCFAAQSHCSLWVRLRGPAAVWRGALSRPSFAQGPPCEGILMREDCDQVARDASEAGDRGPGVCDRSPSLCQESALFFEREGSVTDCSGRFVLCRATLTWWHTSPPAPHAVLGHAAGCRLLHCSGSRHRRKKRLSLCVAVRLAGLRALDHV